MSTLSVENLQHPSSSNANITLDSNGNATFAGSVVSNNSLGFRNRIINGDMRIDQRNAGASVTPTNGQYTLDRWASYAFGAATSKFTIQQNAGSVTPPTGFTNYLGATSTSAYSVAAGDITSIYQIIEGFNVADLGFGTASAKTVTLSFWVRSSLTGTFGGALKNSNGTRSYAFTFTVNAANTWEQKSITVAGDTTGTWLTTNGQGLNIVFSLGTGSTYSTTAGTWAAGDFYSATGATSVVGTNGATFYITGVQLEVGSVATPFERRPYGTELSLCQRYYYRLRVTNTASPTEDWNLFGYANSTTVGLAPVFFPVTMRARPTALEQSGTASDTSVAYATGSIRSSSSVPAFLAASTEGASITFTVSTGLTAGSGIRPVAASANAFLAWSAEL